jgi:PEGA domain
MKKLILFALLLIAVANLYSQKSHIQVIADPGISILIDGVFKGVTNAEFGGLIIQDLEPGNHSIEAKKEGFKTQSDNIKLSPGQVLSYNLDDFFENISISERGEEDEDLIKRNVGSLKIQSLPVELGISISGLGINYQKQKDSWTAENVPSGEFAADFTWNAKSLSYTVEIKPEMESHYMVNMVNDEVKLIGIYPIPAGTDESPIQESNSAEKKKKPAIIYHNTISITSILHGAGYGYYGLRYAWKREWGGFVETTISPRTSEYTFGIGVSRHIASIFSAYAGGGLFSDVYNFSSPDAYRTARGYFDVGATIEIKRLSVSAGAFISNDPAGKLSIGFSF